MSSLTHDTPPPPFPPSCSLSSRNPYYKNERKTAEVHILRSFEGDFYGAHLRVSVTGFLRNELNFTTLEALIDMINTDIRLAKECLSSGGVFAINDATSAFFAALLPTAVTATATPVPSQLLNAT